MKFWALTAVGIAHRTSEGHTSCCCCCWSESAGVVGAGSSKSHWRSTENTGVGCTGRGEKVVPQRAAASRINSAKSERDFEAEEWRREPQKPLQAGVGSMCATCNQEVKEMKPRFFSLFFFFLLLRLPPTSPSEAARNVCGFRCRCRRLHRSAAARNDVSRTHGNFPKQRQVCVVGVVAGGKGWVGGGSGGGGGGQGGGGKV